MVRDGKVDGGSAQLGVSFGPLIVRISMSQRDLVSRETPTQFLSNATS
jgi:hypothetical protein